MRFQELSNYLYYAKEQKLDHCGIGNHIKNWASLVAWSAHQTCSFRFSKHFHFFQNEILSLFIHHMYYWEIPNSHYNGKFQ